MKKLLKFSSFVFGLTVLSFNCGNLAAEEDKQGDTGVTSIGIQFSSGPLATKYEYGSVFDKVDLCDYRSDPNGDKELEKIYKKGGQDLTDKEKEVCRTKYTNEKWHLPRENDEIKKSFAKNRENLSALNILTSDFGQELTSSKNKILNKVRSNLFDKIKKVGTVPLNYIGDPSSYDNFDTLNANVEKIQSLQADKIESEDFSKFLGEKLDKRAPKTVKEFLTQFDTSTTGNGTANGEKCFSQLTSYLGSKSELCSWLRDNTEQGTYGTARTSLNSLLSKSYAMEDQTREGLYRKIKDLELSFLFKNEASNAVEGNGTPGTAPANSGLKNDITSFFKVPGTVTGGPGHDAQISGCSSRPACASGSYYDISTRGGNGVGDKVVAPHDGVVIQSGSGGAWGYFALVAYSNKIGQFFAHMAPTSLIPSGSHIKKGDTIGFEASTGNSTGTHTHTSIFEAKTPGKFVGGNSPQSCEWDDALSCQNLNLKSGDTVAANQVLLKKTDSNTKITNDKKASQAK